MYSVNVISGMQGLSFLVLKSICLSSSLVHFKNGHKYLKRGNSPGIYPFDKVPAIEFCLEQIFDSSEILFLDFFFHFHSFVSASNIPKYL